MAEMKADMRADMWADMRADMGELHRTERVGSKSHTEDLKLVIPLLSRL
jgi:hypothetical protein